MTVRRVQISKSNGETRLLGKTTVLGWIYLTIKYTRAKLYL